MYYKKIIALALVTAALVVAAPTAEAETLSIESLQKQILMLKQQIQQILTMLSQLQTPICAKTLSGTPSNTEIEACAKAGGTINCGNGWCKCSCGQSCAKEGEIIDISGTKKCCEGLYADPGCTNCSADSWTCRKSATDCATEGGMFSAVYTDNYPSKCCQGLTEWASGMDTREIVNGLCKETGKVAGSPVGTCLNCGNGICESPENICNCAKDCGESGRYKCSSANDCTASCAYGCVNKTWVSKMADCPRVPSYACSCQKNKCLQSDACPGPLTSGGGQSCTQNITYAKDPVSGQCCQYGTPCSAPEGWETYYGKEECAAGCNGTDKVYYTCADGTKVTQCTCANKKLKCVKSPESLCPVSCASEGEKIYGSNLADGMLTACCKGLTEISPYPDAGLGPNDGSSVCAYCGNGKCGLGENKANCPMDCEIACKKEGELFGYLEAECCEGLLKVYPEGAATYKTGDSQNFQVTCKKK